MLIGGGKIVVAVIGAAILVVAGVFIVKSVWWPTSSESTGATTSSVTASGSAEETSGAQESSSPSEEPMPESTTTTSTTTTPQAEPFSESSTHVQSEINTVAVDVELPQVQGGTADVADSFNQAMRAALDDQAASVAGGNLDGGASRVDIGEHVLSGVLLTTASAADADQSIPMVSTVVVDASTGATISLSDLFSDKETGLNRLLEEAQALGPTESSVTADFDGSALSADETTFAHWTPDSSGMTVYFDQGVVGPNAAGIVELTIPWANLDDVLNPDTAAIVQS